MTSSSSILNENIAPEQKKLFWNSQNGSSFENYKEPIYLKISAYHELNIKLALVKDTHDCNSSALRRYIYTKRDNKA